MSSAKGAAVIDVYNYSIRGDMPGSFTASFNEANEIVNVSGSDESQVLCQVRFW